MARSSLQSSHDQKAFTLVELLAAMSLLMIITGIVSQLMNRATNAIDGSGKRLDADAQARLIFDRMANDFSHMLKRADADSLFNKATGNDSFYFYSEVPGFFAGSAVSRNSISLIGYRINQNHPRYPGQPVLERLGKGLSWEGPESPVFLTYSSPRDIAPVPSSTLTGRWPQVIGGTTNDDYIVLSDQVYRLEISFLLRDGSISTSPSLSSGGRPNGLKDVNAIIVALAILDSTSRRMAGDFSRLEGALPDSVDPGGSGGGTLGSSPLETWNRSSYLTSSGLPKEAASQLRLYQRYFFLR